MAYDEGLATRIRDLIGPDPRFTERKMFGGLGFMLDGNMCVGVHADELIARVGPENTAAEVERPGARLFDMSGRPMSGWLLVDPAAIAEDDALAGWIERCSAFAGSLPPK